jgi:hypothetical protein
MAGSSYAAFFKRYFINTSSGDESDNDTNISMVVALLIHEHNENELPKFNGSVKGIRTH